MMAADERPSPVVPYRPPRRDERELLDRALNRPYSGSTLLKLPSIAFWALSKSGDDPYWMRRGAIG